MDLVEIEKVVASIQSNLFKNSNSFSVGMLKSHFKGAGLQFKEHQVYAPGDDVRFIDWKLSAKTNTTFVKTFEEERNIEIRVFLDLSETMLIGYKNVSKLQAAIEIVCLLYLLAEKTKDHIAPIFFTNKPIMLPLSSGKEGIVLFISQLEKEGILKHGKVNFDYDFKHKVDEKKKIALIKSFVAKDKEVVLLTDFGEIENFEQLNKLLFRRNIHCFKIESPLESTTKYPFFIFARNKGERFLTKGHKKEEKSGPKGRFKKINVKERYLEKFIREML